MCIMGNVEVAYACKKIPKKILRLVISGKICLIYS